MLPTTIEKAPAYCALIPLGKHPDIIRIQDMVRGILAERGIAAEYTDPNDFHITVAYATKPGDLPAFDAPAFTGQAFSVLVEAIDTFEPKPNFDAPMGYAVHLRVRLNGELAVLNHDFVMHMRELGCEISPYSEPGSYTPHITIAYAQSNFGALDIAPFPVVVDRVEISGGDHLPLVEAALKMWQEIVTDQERTYFTAPTAIKAIGEGMGEVGGYLAVWGDSNRRDLQGEYFTPDTDFKLSYYTQRPVLYHHGIDDHVKSVQIGVIYEIKADAVGLYAKARLDINHEDPHIRRIARKVYEMVLAGKLGWSSGSIPHLVEVEADGRITHWPIVEGSATPTPAEPKRTTIQALKMEINAPEAEPDAAPIEPIGAEGAAADAVADTSANPAPPIAHAARSQTRRVKSMDAALLAALEKAGLNAEQTLAVMKEMATAPADGNDGMAADEESTPEVLPEDELAELEGKTGGAANMPAKTAIINPKQVAKDILRELNAAKARAAAAGDAPPAFTGGRPDAAKANIQVISKYHKLTAAEMAFLVDLRTTKGRTVGIDAQFMREMNDKAVKAFEAGKLDLDEKDHPRIMALKADLNNTGVAGDGGDWVPTLWTSDLWERTRIENMVASSIETFQLPSASYEYPLESDDPEVYAVGETDDNAELSLVSGGTFTSSKLTVDKMTFNAKKLGIRVPFSMEITEDSIIQFIPQLRNQSLRAMQNAIDNVILNADATTGTTNINYADGNTSSVPKAKFLYGGGDGMRHLALVDNAAVQVDAQNTAPTLSLFRRVKAKLLGAYSVRPSELVAFVDVQTWHKMLGIDELLVWMNNGRGSTVNDGVLPTIDGIPVYPSQELSLTNAAGFVSATAGNNTRGQVLIEHRPSWKLGYMRQITSDVSYLPYYDVYVMTLTARAAVGRRDTACGALLFNLNVA